MNILVIGNGFDLAHEMPTRYSDFLDFMTLYIIKNYPEWKGWGGDPSVDEFSPRKYYNSTLLKISEKIPRDSKIRIFFNKYEEKFKSQINEHESLNTFYWNTFLRYCLNCYDYRLSFNSEFNWIDIENEIYTFLIELQKQKFSEDTLENLSIMMPQMHGISKRVIVPFFISNVYYYLNSKDIPQESLKKEIFRYLFGELENFSLLLKIYLKIVSEDFQENPQQKFKINFKDDSGGYNGIFIDKILSFNYTNTSEIYVSPESINFINGSLEENNIILGIENPESAENNSNDSITFFFKNVQRVLYNFYYSYKNWFGYNDSKIEKVNNKNIINNGKQIYIIGHSLSSSDKYILTDLMMNANKVTIYYYSPKDREDKISNLYKILGDQKFSQHVNNETATPYIKLVNQSEITIKNS